MTRSASAATAGWARALVNSRFEAYANHAKATRAAAPGRTTWNGTTSAQRAFVPRGVANALNRTTQYNELLNHLEISETLTGITPAQRALAPRRVEKARQGTTWHNGPSSHVRFVPSWLHSFLMPKRQKVNYEIETTLRLRRAQRVGVQLPRAQAQTSQKTPISCAKRSTATPCWTLLFNSCLLRYKDNMFIVVALEQFRADVRLCRKGTGQLPARVDEVELPLL